MRSKANTLKFIVCLLIFGLSPHIAFAGSGFGTFMRDPLFGMIYDRSAVKFQPVDSGFCAFHTKENTDQLRWLYGSVQTSRTTFYLVGGYDFTDYKSNLVKKDSFSLIGADDNIDCRKIGTVQDIFAAVNRSGKYTPAAETDLEDFYIDLDTLKALADDAVQRYARAFGGANQLKAALQKQHKLPSKTKNPILFDALEKLN